MTTENVGESESGILAELTREKSSDEVLNDLSAGIRQEKLDRQREDLAQAEIEANRWPKKTNVAARGHMTTEDKAALEAANAKAVTPPIINEPTLTGGIVPVQNGFIKPEVDPTKKYTNYPIKNIDGHKVTFIGARPFHDRDCRWDEDYRSNYQHFKQCDHPHYHNAAYVEIRFADHEKKVWPAYVVKNDTDIELYYVMD